MVALIDDTVSRVLPQAASLDGLHPPALRHGLTADNRDEIIEPGRYSAGTGRLANR